MPTGDFQDVSRDKHLRVNFSPARLPDGPAAPPPDAVARNRRRMEQMNCGFVKVEQLPGNVGYLKFNMFADPEVCGPTATAAMNFIANSDAFIIDVPFARAINPITKTNWEGTGIEPNVTVPAAEALSTAQKLAAERLTPRTPPTPDGRAP